MYRLNPYEISFPNPALNHPRDGLMAVGGDLSVERLSLAYDLGIFPWFNEDEPILWWCPDPRFVLFPDELKVSKSMRKIMRDQVFTFTENQCFAEVIQHCKKVRRKDQEGTWITEAMQAAYLKLHQIGRAKSLEVWHKGDLVGGFYGVQTGKVFCGESMFSLMSNASKAGFIHFVNKYKSRFKVIDCQVYTEHLESLGARMISKADYLKFLENQAFHSR